ncbi:hypothetical protein Cgig2_002990 [Carnegiea gigantea]|uniref:Ubiquitin-like protease family profile domain-containing protein n=1 Tax=Carnegiea gigantea TaxID=171969 RepID=A0A9Q1K7N1_9CARY|nr:hypothetical protein Cgig2_002990 [Carnegiea gigantea]
MCVVVGVLTVCFISTDVVQSMCTTSLALLTMFACVKRIALVLAFLRSTTYAHAGQWEVVTPKCPEQRNRHDCGVFAMAFMDLLSVKADGFEFNQDSVAHYRDKCLLSFLQGLLAHFPQHLRGMRTSLHCPLPYAQHELRNRASYCASVSEVRHVRVLGRDTELVHIHDSAIVTYTTQVSPRYYLGY